MVANGFEVSAEEKADISKALKRSTNRPEHVERSVKSRIANAKNEPIDKQKRFKISKFIDFISHNTPKELAAKEKERQAKKAIKDRRKNHVCFYSHDNIEFFYENLCKVSAHIGMYPFDDEEIASIHTELMTMAVSMDTAFARVVNRLKQIHRDGVNTIKMAHYLGHIDRESKPLQNPTKREINEINKKVYDIVGAFLQEKFESTQGLFDQSTQGD